MFTPAVEMPKASLQARNLQRVKDLVSEYQKGNPQGYLAGVSDDFKGSVCAGLIPGADNVQSKQEFIELMGAMPTYMTVSKFEPKNWRAVGEDVLFNVDWKFTYHPPGRESKDIETTALVRKVVRDNMICEKFHMFPDVQAITGEPSPHDAYPVQRVQALLKEIADERPEGYMAGVAPDVKADMLGGLIPKADAISNKEEFAGVMKAMGDYMTVQKFEPCNFVALPNSDMMFNVAWKFTYHPPGTEGKEVETTAVVRKVLKDGMICEKYHLLDVEEILQTTPRDIIEAPVAP